mmetsp:Transcript_24107/g.29201  ORF Transcript_24107/g.29201 Transcript_24107/m.29201 type:complete len:411 (+) Transcript_24107:244-1476(+)
MISMSTTSSNSWMCRTSTRCTQPPSSSGVSGLQNPTKIAAQRFRKGSLLLAFPPRARALQSRKLTISCDGRNPFKLSNSESLKVLGLQEEDVKDTKKVKTAFRRLALRYHPDVSGDPESAETFLRIQKAYDKLSRKEEDGDEDDAYSSGMGGEEDGRHDWFYKFKRNSKDAQKRPKEQARANVRAQMSGLKARANARRVRKARAASAHVHHWPADPTASTSSPTSSAATTEAHPHPSTHDSPPPPFHDMHHHSNIHGRPRYQREDDTWHNETPQHHHQHHHAGPNASKSSTTSAHYRLSGQLEGLRGAASTRKRHKKKDSPKWNNAYSTVAATRDDEKHAIMTEHDYTESELRFIRLAKLAREWRDKRSNKPSGTRDKTQYGDTFPKVVKPSARELLQAAVESVSLGACQ